MSGAGLVEGGERGVAEEVHHHPEGVGIGAVVAHGAGLVPGVHPFEDAGQLPVAEGDVVVEVGDRPAAGGLVGGDELGAGSTTSFAGTTGSGSGSGSGAGGGAAASGVASSSSASGCAAAFAT